MTVKVEEVLKMISGALMMIRFAPCLFSLTHMLKHDPQTSRIVAGKACI